MVSGLNFRGEIGCRKTMNENKDEYQGRRGDVRCVVVDELYFMM